MPKLFRDWLLITRVFFVVLVIAQCSIFAEYIRIYSSKEFLLALLSFSLLVLISWVVVLYLYRRSGQLSKLWLVWTVYVIVLGIFIGLIFGWLRERLDRDNFWGPNNLKITICMTPVIALVLIATANNSREYGDLVHRFYGGLVLELFDAIEVLAIVISPENLASSSSVEVQLNPTLNSTNSTFNCTLNTLSVKLPSAFVIAIIALALLSFLLSPLELAENKLLDGEGEHKLHKRMYLCRLVVKKLLVNLALMIVRLVAWLEYKHEASIFIIKNATIMVVAIVGIIRYKNWCGINEPD